MTRVIVRNLPNQITKEKLHELFSEKGTITDIQLKFTKSGKFRKFAFIGYQKPEQANAAIDSLNKTFINTSRIEVEECKALADPQKPRSWSKHASDSSAFKKKRKEGEESKAEHKEEEDVKPAKKSDRKKIKDPKLEQMLLECKDDPMFKEFVASKVNDQEALREITGADDDRPPEVGEKKLADRSISDLEYMKLKTGREKLDIGKDRDDKLEQKKPEKQRKNIKLFTVKIKGLPHKLKKSEIKAFLNAKPFTIRKARKLSGIIFAGFRTEREMKKALFKNRSFFDGKRIFVRQEKEKKELESSAKNEEWEKQENRLKNEETVAESGRIFVRNLPYVATEDDIKEMFEKYGPLADIVYPIDSFTRKPKGFGIVSFVMPEHASRAFTELDGIIFQGRMLHLLPGVDKKNSKADEVGESETNYKTKKLKQDKKNAGSTVNWNTFFINENALAAAMADSYNTTKENVLKDDNNVAVRLALGETQIISKIKEFLEENDVCLDALNDISNCVRSKTTFLVKNLPFGTKAEEIREIFSKYGELKRVLLPPYGVTALVEFIEQSEARKAFRNVAYSKFKSVPLYLEWAPEKIFKNNEPQLKETEKEIEQKESTENQSAKVDSVPDYIPLESATVEGATIFVKNLNFETEDDSLRKHFEKCGSVVWATVARKKDLKQPGKKLSLGYGFVHFSTKEEADTALKRLQFSKLDDHRLELQRSTAGRSSEVKSRREVSHDGKPNTKILVKNVPFQATRREILDLFKVFGEVRTVRLPKKMVGTGPHRGFCFVEFHTVHDAKRAFSALSDSTHLYGRRLVLEWASTDDDDVDVMRMKTAERFAKGKEKGEIVMDEEQAE